MKRRNRISGALSNIVVGESLEKKPREVSLVVGKVLDRTLLAKRVNVTEGDIRYWGVGLAQSAVLQRLKSFGETCFQERTGRRPVSFVMVNYIDAQTCPTGSGGGWHRDSYGSQYKAFAYLTDVERESQGAFGFIPASNSPFVRLPSLAYRVLSGGNRYRDRTINAILRAGFFCQPILLKAGIPFFLDASLIHRGLPIVEGRRIMATVYMYDNAPEEFASFQDSSESVEPARASTE